MTNQVFDSIEFEAKKAALQAARRHVDEQITLTPAELKALMIQKSTEDLKLYNSAWMSHRKIEAPESVQMWATTYATKFYSEYKSAYARFAEKQEQAAWDKHQMGY